MLNLTKLISYFELKRNIRKFVQCYTRKKYFNNEILGFKELIKKISIFYPKQFKVIFSYIQQTRPIPYTTSRILGKSLLLFQLLFTASRRYCQQLGLCHISSLPPLLCHHFLHYTITPSPSSPLPASLLWCLQHNQFKAPLGDQYKFLLCPICASQYSP